MAISISICQASQRVGGRGVGGPSFWRYQYWHHLCIWNAIGHICDSMATAELVAVVCEI